MWPQPFFPGVAMISIFLSSAGHGRCVALVLPGHPALAADTSCHYELRHAHSATQRRGLDGLQVPILAWVSFLGQNTESNRMTLCHVICFS